MPSTPSTSSNQVSEKLMYGNRPGMWLLNELEEMRERMSRIEGETQKLKREVAGLKGQVAAHAQAIDGYAAIGNRLLDVYRRDKLEDADFAHTRDIRIDNDYAHKGDAVTDAILYQQGKRTDRTTYTALYGLRFSEVIELHNAQEDGGVIAMINVHASLLARKDAPPPPEDLQAAFHRFVRELENNWTTRPDTTPGTALGMRYGQYWIEHDHYTRH